MTNYSSSDFEQDNEFQKALAQYEEMKAGNRSIYFDADQLADFAEYYASLQQYDKAFEVIEYALSIHPGNTEVLVIKAHINIDLKNIQEAKVIAYSIPESYDRDVKMLKAELLILEEKLGEAEEILMELINQEENDNVDNLLDIAYLYTDSNLPQLALPWFEKAYKMNPENDEIRIGLVDSYRDCGMIDKGVALYNRLLDIDPYSAKYWYELGRLYFTTEDINKALDAYEFVLTINSANHSAILMMAHCYFKLENYEKSCEYYEKYATMVNNSSTAYFYIGFCQYNLKQYDKSIENLKSSLELSEGVSPEIVDTYTYLAFCYKEKGMFDDALLYIERAIKEDPNNAELYVHKGDILLNGDHKEEAAKAFNTAILMAPDDPRTNIDIGRIYCENKMYDIGLTYYKNVELNAPGFDDIYLSMAFAYGAMGNNEQFTDYLIKATKQDHDKVMDSLKLMPEKEQEELKQLIRDLKKAIDEDEGKAEFN
ncbi:tetratricopeptide repeat protein [Bacteroides sedimenti]|uniref:Tetratricopeptide repeat protein n=1 Tax=Bacteroides sedimenti TaxID=2136147 RepID=A0ABM8I8E2_9BACE